ncbi:MAG: hypothetical protein ACLQME_23155 [Alphaproteobacteria bacterium]
MASPAGESTGGALRLDFDRRLMLRFRGAVTIRIFCNSELTNDSNPECIALSGLGRPRRPQTIG